MSFCELLQLSTFTTEYNYTNLLAPRTPIRGCYFPSHPCPRCSFFRASFNSTSVAAPLRIVSAPLQHYKERF